MLQSGKEFERQELESKKVDELRKICKENGVSYYENGKKITKAAMIDKLLDIINERANSIKQNKQLDKDNTDEHIDAEEAERLEKKKRYVEQAKIGNIVAFKIPENGKVISAMITKKSTNGRKFMVETKYGVEYKISFDDVLWVRTNKRWPKGIYLLFKKNNKVEVTKDGKEIS